MSSKKPKLPKQLQVSSARSRKLGAARQSRPNVRAIVDAVEVSHSKQCAEQLLNARAAVVSGSLVDAPVSDASPVHVFCTETKVTLSPYVISGASACALRLAVNPRPNTHILYGNAYDAGGLPTGNGSVNVENYASWASVYDDVRCAAMMVVVKSCGRTDAENGSAFVGNFNPQSTLWGVASSSLRGEAGIEYPIGKMHYPTVAWLPARPEVDHAFFGPTASQNGDATVLVFDFRGAYEAAPSNVFEFTVFAIWAGRLLNDVEYIARPKIYSIDQSIYEKELQILLYGLPLYSQRRTMHADDGEGGDTAATIAKDIVQGASAGRKLYGAVKDGWEAATQVAESIGNVVSSIFSIFGARERVVRHLSTLSKDELALALQLLQECGPDPRYFQYAVRQERRRRHGSRQYHRTHMDYESDDDDVVSVDARSFRPQGATASGSGYIPPPPTVSSSRPPVR